MDARNIYRFEEPIQGSGGGNFIGVTMNREETATADNQDTPERGKRSTKLKLPKIMDDPGWPSFPIPTSCNSGLASDIKYNRELIEVLQRTSSGTLDELAGLGLRWLSTQLTN